MTPDEFKKLVDTFSTRKDLYAIGLTDIDIALLKEADMEEIAKKMQVSYQENLYVQDLARITFTLIERKNREAQGLEPTFPVMSITRSMLAAASIAEPFHVNLVWYTFHN